MPDVPFVRSDVLSGYRNARDLGLPEISRKNFNLLNYVTAMMKAYLLRKHLKDDADPEFAHCLDDEYSLGNLVFDHVFSYSAV